MRCCFFTVFCCLLGNSSPRFVVILSQVLRSRFTINMDRCAGKMSQRQRQSMNRKSTKARAKEIWIKNYRCDKKSRFKNNRRGDFNNKTIENAKMVSFRIITEFYCHLSLCCCLLVVFFLPLQRLLNMQMQLIKMRMFICPLPRCGALRFHLMTSRWEKGEEKAF